MSSKKPSVNLHHIWKKYSKDVVFHRSFREDITGLMAPLNPNQKLFNNEFWALKDVNLSAQQGQIIGLWGHNGAGKSTILKLISSITYPTKGQIEVEGTVAPIIEVGAGFHPDLTGRENIFLYGVIVGIPLMKVKDHLPSIIDFADLREFIDMPVKKYSSGMYLRLAFSIAIHSQADIYVIDEILMVADEVWRKKCFDKIRDLKKLNRTVILVTHNRTWMESVVDHMITLEHGQVIEATAI